MHLSPTASVGPAPWQNLGAAGPVQAPAALEVPGGDESEVRQAFDSFVGQTFYGQMLASLRKSVGKPAYFHGGQAEEMFRKQLDQVLAEKLSEKSAGQFTGPMFDLFTLQRR